MRKTSLLTLFLLLVAASVFAHAGEVHSFMGTITMLHADGSFMMKTATSKELVVATSKTTSYVRTGGQAASHADLTAGTRVVVTMTKDGRTASAIKIGAAKKN